jgi:hypothetical protein
MAIITITITTQDLLKHPRPPLQLFQHQLHRPNSPLMAEYQSWAALDMATLQQEYM